MVTYDSRIYNPAPIGTTVAAGQVKLEKKGGHWQVLPYF